MVTSFYWTPSRCLNHTTSTWKNLASNDEKTTFEMILYLTTLLALFHTPATSKIINIISILLFPLLVKKFVCLLVNHVTTSTYNDVPSAILYACRLRILTTPNIKLILLFLLQVKKFVCLLLNHATTTYIVAKYKY